MGFQALLTREDYYGILKDTLYSYYSEKFGNDIYVGYEYRDGAKTFIMNSKLGMIFTPFPNRKIRKYIYKSYKIRNNTVKNIAAKLFVFLSTHSRKLFTLPQKLYVFPASIVSDDIVFSYLNRSIRIFDFKNDTTVSIQKNSFTSRYFDNQLSFRLKYKYDFIPSILSYGECWFEERILSGCSLARETNSHIFKEGMKNALFEMCTIQKTTLLSVNMNEYVTNLQQKILELLESAHTAKRIHTYDVSKHYVDCLSNMLSNKEQYIPVAESHGDLQAGNIWLENGKSWIIDWETHAIRSVWFDAVTIKYGTRYHGGINMLAQASSSEDVLQSIMCGFNCDLSFKDMKVIFLLEDLLFTLEDMMELPCEGGRESFDAYMNDIVNTKTIKSLEKS